MLAVPACPACGSAARSPRPFRVRDHLGSGIEAGQGQPWRLPLAWLGVPVRLLASLAGSLSPRWGEETVVIARRPRLLSAEPVGIAPADV